jgi:hypothetical protein
VRERVEGLPLKILIWADGSRTNVTYYSPEAIASRYGLSAELAAALLAPAARLQLA